MTRHLNNAIYLLAQDFTEEAIQGRLRTYQTLAMEKFVELYDYPVSEYPLGFIIDTKTSVLYVSFRMLDYRTLVLDASTSSEDVDFRPATFQIGPNIESPVTNIAYSLKSYCTFIDGDFLE